MTQRWFTITILLAFTAIAVFGFLGMVHGEAHTGCIAVAARAAACPSGPAPFADIAFHVAAWKGFSATAAPSSLLLAIVILVASIAIPWERHRFRASASHRELQHPVIVSQPISVLLPAFFRWIAIHERRDPPSPCYA